MRVARSLTRLDVIIATLAVFTVTGSAQIFGVLDGLSHAPPALFSYAYNSFVPPATPAANYFDPVFGTTVHRVTADHSVDDIYARNMWWNADETRYLHRNPNGTAFPDYMAVIDIATGTVTHNGIPIGTLPGDEGFDPVNPDVLYYMSGSSIHQVTLGPNGTWLDAIDFTTPDGSPLRPLGATLNWLDAAGRYMVVRYGAEPSVHLYDRQNLAAGPYANPVDGASTIDTGSYVGISPDGRFLVGYQGADGSAGSYHLGQGVSWAIDHVNRAAAPAPTVFWSLCGDHGTFISPSDGRDYMVVSDCNNYPELWRVDVTNDVTGLDEDVQRALPNNLRLMTWPTWDEVGNHVSTVARGALRDWAFYSSEDSTDTYNSGSADVSGGITPWHAYRQEIIAFNVLTGEIRRLAQHRSRSVTDNYYNTPRVSASWGGRWVGWASNFNRATCPGCPGIVDIYAVQFSGPLARRGPRARAGIP